MPRNRAVFGEYRALEASLWDAIAALQRDDSCARLTVIVPTTFLVEHLKVASVRRFTQGLFGVRFVTLFQFALDLSGGGAERFVGDALFSEELLREWLVAGDASGRALGGGTADPYSLAGALMGAVRDLRDAAVPRDPAVVLESLRAAAGDAASHVTALDVEKIGIVLGAYGHYVDRLDACAGLDRADVYRLATANVGGPGDPLAVYGFYDLLQVQADFLAEICRAHALTFFVPSGDDAPTWRFGSWMAETFVPALGVEIERVGGAPELPAPEICTAVGEAGEVWQCAKEMRRLLDTGEAPDRIAVVARAVEPYVPHLAEAFAEHCIPWRGPSPFALLDHPLTVAIRALFRADVEGFERGQVLDLVCHPAFHATGSRQEWAAVARRLRIRRGEDWDRLGHALAMEAETLGPTAEAPLVPTDGGPLVQAAGAPLLQTDGLRGMSAGVPAATEGRLRPSATSDVRSLSDALASLQGCVWPSAGGWGELAEFHAAALARIFSVEAMTPEEHSVWAVVHEVLRTLARLEVLGGSVPRALFLDAFDRECRRRRAPSENDGGVRVLDVMEARGLSFTHVFLLGVNARVFPRFIVEEPFVGDAVRREVYRVLGHHLAVRLDAYDEERLLFHLVRAAATERFVCTYQRADAQGRPRDPSPLLRPFLPWDRSTVPAVPCAEYGKRRAAVVRTPREEIFLAADLEAALAAFGYDGAAFARGRRVLQALADAAGVGPHDGYTGPPAAATHAADTPALSVTRLERYGACPFRVFAEDVLGLSDELEATDDLLAHERGRLMHEVLAAFYRAGVPADADSAATAVESAARLVFEGFEARTGLRLCGLRAVRCRQIVRAVTAFAVWDAADRGLWVPTWFEEGAEVPVGGRSVRAIVDRIDRHRDTGCVRVIEYKWRYHDAWRTKLTTLASRGRSLQAPVYLALAPAVAHRLLNKGTTEDVAATAAIVRFVENFVTHPVPADAAPTRRHSAALSADDAAGVWPGVERVVEVFAGMLDAGWYFVRPDEGRGGHCAHCPFGSVCRKAHPGVRARSAPDRTPALRPYWDIVGGAARTAS
jgi:ATP-dependent helicase/nuclease subunit B